MCVCVCARARACVFACARVRVRARARAPVCPSACARMRSVCAYALCVGRASRPPPLWLTIGRDLRRRVGATQPLRCASRPIPSGVGRASRPPHLVNGVAVTCRCRLVTCPCRWSRVAVAWSRVAVAGHVSLSPASRPLPCDPGRLLRVATDHHRRQRVAVAWSETQAACGRKCGFATWRAARRRYPASRVRALTVGRANVRTRADSPGRR